MLDFSQSRYQLYRSLKFPMMVTSSSNRLDRTLGTEQIIGKIALTLGTGEELKKFPDGEIRLSDGTVPPLDDNVRVLPKHLELSNVNITEELINSIEDQRQYEINIKMIASASELDEAGTSLMRLPS